MDIKEIIRKYLENNKVMQLSTVIDDNPEICTLHFAFDNELNIYWFSYKDTNHSRRLKENKNTAIGIIENIESRQCVHAQGESFELGNDDALKAHEIYTKRFGVDNETRDEIASGKELEYSYYIFKVSKFVLFDLKNFPEDPKQELVL